MEVDKQPPQPLPEQRSRKKRKRTIVPSSEKRDGDEDVCKKKKRRRRAQPHKTSQPSPPPSLPPHEDETKNKKTPKRQHKKTPKRQHKKTPKRQHKKPKTQTQTKTKKPKPKPKTEHGRIRRRKSRPAGSNDEDSETTPPQLSKVEILRRTMNRRLKNRVPTSVELGDKHVASLETLLVLMVIMSERPLARRPVPHAAQIADAIEAMLVACDRSQTRLSLADDGGDQNVAAPPNWTDTLEWHLSSHELASWIYEWRRQLAIKLNKANKEMTKKSSETTAALAAYKRISHTLLESNYDFVSNVNIVTKALHISAESKPCARLALNTLVYMMRIWSAFSVTSASR